MLTLDQIMDNNYEAVCTSKENLKEIIQEAVDRIMEGNADPAAVCIAKGRDDHIIKFSYSYTGWSFDEVTIHF